MRNFRIGCCEVLASKSFVFNKALMVLFRGVAGMMSEGLGPVASLNADLVSESATIRELIGSVNITALQGSYSAFQVAGGIRQHPRRGNSWARCCAVGSQVDRAF